MRPRTPSRSEFKTAVMRVLRAFHRAAPSFNRWANANTAASAACQRFSEAVMRPIKSEKELET